MEKKVLLTGYTEFIAEGFLKAAFPQDRVLISGDCSLKNSTGKKRIVHHGSMSEKEFKKYLDIYDFDEIVFFSSSLNPFGFIAGEEIELLAHIFNLCTAEQKIICVLSMQKEVGKMKPLLLGVELDMCRTATEKFENLVVVSSPWIYSSDYLQKNVVTLFEEGMHNFGVSPDSNLSFVAAEDVAVLLHRLTENWPVSRTTLQIPAKFCRRADQVKKAFMSACDTAVDYTYTDTRTVDQDLHDNLVLRNSYQWFPVYSFFDDIHILFAKYKESKKKKSQFGKWFYDHLNEQSKFIQVLELLVGFLITEGIIRLTGVSVQFNLVDFRLMFIMIIGIMYNLQMGLAAAFLESVSLAFAYQQQGTNFVALFYEPSNWLAFVVYFMAGAVCGYIRAKDMEKIKSTNEENGSITSRYEYLSDVMETVLQDKDEYKKQVIGSRDSFGRIFQIVQRLDYLEPESIMNQALSIMEEELSNSSVAVYSCSEKFRYGRLLIASKDQNLPYSAISEGWIQKLKEAQDGTVWVNRDMSPDYPRYMYGIRNDGELTMILMLMTAKDSQMSLYYLNLFKVIGGLISNALLRAQRHTEALFKERCVEGTASILNDAAFAEILEQAHISKERKTSVHVLLRVHSDASADYALMEHRVSQCIRATDTIGLHDGSVYILLRQAKESDLVHVMPRFEKAEISVDIVSFSDEAKLLNL